MVHVWVLGSGTQSKAKRNANATKRAVVQRENRSQVKSATGASWKLARGLFIVAAFLLLFAGLSFMRSFADEPASNVPAADEIIVIADSGDTLWGIASEVKRGSLDTREAVHQIMERNALSSSSIDSGTRLIIPADVTAR